MNAISEGNDVRPSHTGDIDCGDTNDCIDCNIMGVGLKNPKGQKSLTLNKMGRCDFYAGPKSVINNTSKKK